jgi:acylphosphatase
MEGNELERIHLQVFGRVQGVGFRHFVMMRAQEIGLTGWVRNRHQGYVEIVAEGEKDKLGLLINHVKKGPTSSHVSDLKIEWLDANGQYKQFQVRMTA